MAQRKVSPKGKERNAGRPRGGAHPRGVRAGERKTLPPKKKEGQAQVCSGCGLVHHMGRWYRGAPPLTEVRETLCPACTAIARRRPGGTVRIHGDLFAERDEIAGLIANAEAAESAEHPLERLIAFDSDPKGMRVTTTGIHLARRIAHGLRRRFHRRLRVAYDQDAALFTIEPV